MARHRTHRITVPALGGLARAAALGALVFSAGMLGEARAAYDTPVNGFAMYDEPKLPPDFKNFPYVNPDAPKGGTLRMALVGSYDTFNPFILKGNPVDGLGPLSKDSVVLVPTSVFESLAVYSNDEPFTMYGLIAKTIEVPKDRSSVTFNLRKEARFQDGTPITADDVIFSFTTLRDKGAPFFRNYYASVAKVEKNGPLSVTFRFVSANQKELPLILGELPVLSKAYWTKHDITQSTIEPPLGSGPYRVAKFDIGNYVVYERDKNYWGKDLPVNVGRFNFDTVRVNYYRVDFPAFEAFKAGQADVWVETSANRWATSYDFPAMKRGDVLRARVPLGTTQGVEGLFFNTRRPIFQDRRVREALGNAFDFEWENKIIAYNQYAHARSYFNNSDLEAKGVPQGLELQILEPFRGKIPDDVFTKEFNPPSTAHATVRDNLRDAQQLLASAGWKIDKDGIMKNAAGEPLKFEILMYTSPDLERLVLPIVANFKLLGIQAELRAVDQGQFINRVRAFDYDMVFGGIGESDSPGNEQRAFWGTKAASEPGSRNYAGVHDPAIDSVIEGLVHADTRADLVAHVHALDRLLQYGYYVIPFWYLPAQRIAWWKQFHHPDATPQSGPGFTDWWTTGPAPSETPPAPK